MNKQRLGSSYRDPNGFMFLSGDVLFRQINTIYQGQYKQLIESGLYDELVKKELLVQHKEVGVKPFLPDIAYKVIEPEKIEFISYPYEWCFSQLQDAALNTLKILKIALKYGMSLKDSSAYNIQFHQKNAKPLLIDTLSFEQYNEGQPWIAYRQFCQFFLAPLALMAHTDIRLNQLLRVYINGIPLDLASKLLPARTRLSYGLAIHIHMHAAAQRRYADRSLGASQSSNRMSRTQFLGLIDSLERTVKKLHLGLKASEWSNYYQSTTYSDEAMENKIAIVNLFFDKVQPKKVWDLGANTGLFSRLSSSRGITTLAFDIDPYAVELNYLSIKEEKLSHLLPLVLDLTNPSPDIGWSNRERESLIKRGPTDTVVALALIHHLAISNNVPFNQLAQFFSTLSDHLLIEFIPKEDSQVQKLLSSREDIFPNYNLENFKKVFSECFIIHSCERIKDSQRHLLLLDKRI
jgi:ribosomal protein L11 methylase PrmA